MSGNLLAIGKTGLYAAQAALSTTGHNITNANVAGYSRQVVVQAASAALNTSVGFMGTGTEIAQIKRYSDNFLNTQVRNAQASTSGLESYYSQIKQIDNLLGGVVAEELAQGFLVPGDAVAINQIDKIPLGITRQRRFTKMRIVRQIRRRFGIEVGEVAAATARHQNLASWLFAVIQQ